MIRLFTFSLLVTIGIFSAGQPGINYHHKRLYKELEREWGYVNPRMEEIKIPGSPNGSESLSGKFFRVRDKHSGGPAHYIFIGRVNSCRAGGCSIAPDDQFSGDSEYFDYFLFFDSVPSVLLIRIFNYQATHGHEVSAKGWLKQFEGYKGTSPLEIGRNIDAISGATISAYGIAADVELKTKLLHFLLHGPQK